MRDSIVWIAVFVAASLYGGAIVHLYGGAIVQRDEARREADHYKRLADDLDHAALILGEPWSIMHGAATITRDLADGTANGWVGWLHDQDPLAPCIDGPGYVVCVAIKDTCMEPTNANP